MQLRHTHAGARSLIARWQAGSLARKVVVSDGVAPHGTGTCKDAPQPAAVHRRPGTSTQAGPPVMT
jgi:hypothetical protein